MNIVDGLLLFVLVISVIYGFYHGFIRSVASLIGAGLSILGGLFLGPKLSALLSNNEQIRNILANYSDAVFRVGDYELASSPVVQVSGSQLQTVVDSVSFPEPIKALLKDNILTQAFSGKGLASVNDYVSSTLIQSVLSVISFLLCCAVVYLVFTLLVSVISHVFEVPILRQLDWLAGGLFGLARGAVFCYLLVLLVPLVMVVIPDERVIRLINDSGIAALFKNDGFLMRIIRG